MFNPESSSRKPEEDKGIDLEELGNSVQKEAEKLSRDVSQKTAGEEYISEYQTRKSKIRGTEIERGAAFRFERGQIYKAYKILRADIREAKEGSGDTTSKKELLRTIREKAKATEKDLDELNRQFYENAKDIEIETEYGKFTMPVVELDLRKDIDPSEDKRTPYVFLGGIGSDAIKGAAFSMALALHGHKVYATQQPEQPCVKKPENFRQILAEQGDMKIHAAIAKQTIRNLGLENINLVGWSTGATTALEIACDPDFKSINDLIALEPLGFEAKGLPKLAKEAAIKLPLAAFPYSETRIKGFAQGAEAGQADLALMFETGKILSKKLLSPERMSKINPKGRFQVWMGTRSSYTNVRVSENVLSKTEELRQENNPGASPLEIYEVSGSDHFLPLVNALGLVETMSQERPDKSITKIKKSDLKNSAVQEILTSHE